DDIVAGIEAAMHCERPFAVYNLGGAQTTSLAELVQLLERALGRPARRRLLPEQPGDMPMTFADVSLAEKELGYRCSTSLPDGIERFCRWYVAAKSEGRVR